MHEREHGLSIHAKLQARALDNVVEICERIDERGEFHANSHPDLAIVDAFIREPRHDVTTEAHEIVLLVFFVRVERRFEQLEELLGDQPEPEPHAVVGRHLRSDLHGRVHLKVKLGYLGTTPKASKLRLQHAHFFELLRAPGLQGVTLLAELLHLVQKVAQLRLAQSNGAYWRGLLCVFVTRGFDLIEQPPQHTRARYSRHAPLVGLYMCVTTQQLPLPFDFRGAQRAIGQWHATRISAGYDWRCAPDSASGEVKPVLASV